MNQMNAIGHQLPINRKALISSAVDLEIVKQIHWRDWYIST